ncbi:MAG TPA: hypothetical protein VFB45_18625 [Pseudolabrys sp.]|nr:hypothetical protein [Pseudolabrys sp.]
MPYLYRLGFAVRIAALAICGLLATSSSRAETNGFHFSGPGFDVHVTQEPGTTNYVGHFRFGEGSSAIVGSGHFGPPGETSKAPAAKPNAKPDNDPGCPAGTTPEGEKCRPNPQ